MRLVTFLQDGGLRLGALQMLDGRECVVDLNRADPHVPTNIIDFLNGLKFRLTG